MQCVHPIRVFNNNALRGDFATGFEPIDVLVPCGKCIACRINKTREWSGRIIMESCFWVDSVFLTLTYDSQFLPIDNGLHKDDLQRFFKRLRKQLSKKGREISYFACGEYGDSFGRPHYHAIVFGLNPIRDEPLVRRCWTRGTSLKFGSVTPQSIGYVTGYVQKKLTGDAQVNYLGNEPPFMINSQGLGDRFVLKYRDTLRRTGCFRFMEKSYPLCKRHKDMIYDDFDKHINMMLNWYDRKPAEDMLEELRLQERHMIAQYNRFKSPSERRIWSF